MKFLQILCLKAETWPLIDSLRPVTCEDLNWASLLGVRNMWTHAQLLSFASLKSRRCKTKPVSPSSARLKRWALVALNHTWSAPCWSESAFHPDWEIWLFTGLHRPARTVEAMGLLSYWSCRTLAIVSQNFFTYFWRFQVTLMGLRTNLLMLLTKASFLVSFAHHRGTHSFHMTSYTYKN